MDHRGEVCLRKQLNVIFQKAVNLPAASSLSSSSPFHTLLPTPHTVNDPQYFYFMCDERYPQPSFCSVAGQEEEGGEWISSFWKRYVD